MQVKRVDFRSPAASADFFSSLRETGFAVLKNHPIKKELIDQVYKEWERFFGRKDKERYKYQNINGAQSGYFPFKSENAKNVPVKDLKEFFHYYRTLTTLPSEFSGATGEIYDELSKLAATLLNWTEQHLPEPIQASLSCPLSRMIENSDVTLLRILHYPPLSAEDAKTGAVRAAAHEDINLLTLLVSATQPGLEVMDNEGKWHTVECNPGEIAVNSGDMLKCATGGYLGSTTHRVVNPTGEGAKASRFSMPLFLHPRPDVVLSPQYTAKSYLDERLKELGLK